MENQGNLPDQPITKWVNMDFYEQFALSGMNEFPKCTVCNCDYNYARTQKNTDNFSRYYWYCKSNCKQGFLGFVDQNEEQRKEKPYTLKPPLDTSMLKNKLQYLSNAALIEQMDMQKKAYERLVSRFDFVIKANGLVDAVDADIVDESELVVNNEKVFDNDETLFTPAPVVNGRPVHTTTVRPTKRRATDPLAPELPVTTPLRSSQSTDVASSDLSSSNASSVGMLKQPRKQINPQRYVKPVDSMKA